jgi:hypothetical protein
MFTVYMQRPFYLGQVRPSLQQKESLFEYNTCKAMKHEMKYLAPDLHDSSRRQYWLSLHAR